jgi:NAD(P)-dependent dehydrogenase (short-subunit alcohol dehydrogenase family)
MNSNFTTIHQNFVYSNSSKICQNQNLKNMNIVITGASSGIGYATALKFAENKDNRIIAIARNKQLLTKLVDAKLASNSPGEIIPLVFDLESKDMSTVIKEAQKLGKINILINNAAVLVNKKFSELGDQDWERIYSVNVFGQARIIRTLLPFFDKNDYSHIINISSMGGFQGSDKFPGLAAYSSSKAAMINMTECLATELIDDNISVNCLALGTVATEMQKKAFPDYKAKIQPEDIAEYLVYFSENGAKYYNGSVLPVSLTTL